MEEIFKFDSTFNLTGLIDLSEENEEDKKMEPPDSDNRFIKILKWFNTKKIRDTKIRFYITETEYWTPNSNNGGYCEIHTKRLGERGSRTLIGHGPWIKIEG